MKTKYSYYHTHYIQNTLVVKPTHRDLMITPDFIIGVMDSKMQFVSEGAALFVKRVGLKDLLDLKTIEKIIDTD
jgi:hypothetical protein